MNEMTDDQDSFKSLPVAATRRAPVHVGLGVAVVLSCALFGYGISVVMPLHPTPAASEGRQSAVATLRDNLKTTLPATSTTAARTMGFLDVPRDPGPPAPAEGQNPRSPQAPAVETGSVDHPPQPPRVAEASEKEPANTDKPQEMGRAEPRASHATTRDFRRPLPAKQGPVEKIWSKFLLFARMSVEKFHTHHLIR
jgi:hypothetical protein